MGEPGSKAMTRWAWWLLPVMVMWAIVVSEPAAWAAEGYYESQVRYALQARSRALAEEGLSSKVDRFFELRRKGELDPDNLWTELILADPKQLVPLLVPFENDKDTRVQAAAYELDGYTSSHSANPRIRRAYAKRIVKALALGRRHGTVYRYVLGLDPEDFDQKDRDAIAAVVAAPSAERKDFLLAGIVGGDQVVAALRARLKVDRKERSADLKAIEKLKVTKPSGSRIESMRRRLATLSGVSLALARLGDREQSEGVLRFVEHDANRWLPAFEAKNRFERILYYRNDLAYIRHPKAVGLLIDCLKSGGAFQGSSDAIAPSYAQAAAAGLVQCVRGVPFRRIETVAGFSAHWFTPTDIARGRKWFDERKITEADMVGGPRPWQLAKPVYLLHRD